MHVDTSPMPRCVRVIENGSPLHTSAKMDQTCYISCGLVETWRSVRLSRIPPCTIYVGIIQGGVTSGNTEPERQTIHTNGTLSEGKITAGARCKNRVWITSAILESGVVAVEIHVIIAHLG